MKFKNRQNELITATDGRQFWISRAPAVTTCVVAEIGKEQYILLNKRGPGCPDYIGYWVLPCGYLDWDETGGEAAIREVWEECGLDLLELHANPEFKVKNNLLYMSGVYRNVPWRTITDPAASNEQNIVFHYGAVFEGKKFPVVSAANCEHSEVDEVRWFSREEAIGAKLAYNQEGLIKRFFNHLDLST